MASVGGIGNILDKMHNLLELEAIVLAVSVSRLIIHAEGITLDDVEHTGGRSTRTRRSVYTLLPLGARHDAGITAHMATRREDGDLLDGNTIALAAGAVNDWWCIGLLLEVTDNGEVPQRPDAANKLLRQSSDIVSLLTNIPDEILNVVRDVLSLGLPFVLATLSQIKRLVRKARQGTVNSC